MSILIKGIPLAGYEISIMKDGERYRARVDGIWCEVEEIPTTDTDSDTISRAKAIEALRAMQTYKLFAGDDMLLIDQAGAQTELMMLPPAQPEPSQVAKDIARIVGNGEDMRVIAQGRIRGRWIIRETSSGDTEARCSHCGFTTLVDEPGNGLHMVSDLNFCSNCGAEMREVTT